MLDPERYIGAPVDPIYQQLRDHKDEYAELQTSLFHHKNYIERLEVRMSILEGQLRDKRQQSLAYRTRLERLEGEVRLLRKRDSTVQTLNHDVDQLKKRSFY